MNYFLSLEMKQEPEGIFIGQRGYVRELLSLLNMKDCKLVTTPMGVNEKVEVEICDEFIDARMYRSLIDKLLYLTHTRPDIGYVVNFLPREDSSGDCQACSEVTYLCCLPDYVD